MSITKLLADYEHGPLLLRPLLSGMTAEQIDAAPVPGKWSTRQVICHLADADLLYANRFKQIIVEDQPVVAVMDPDDYAERLFYDRRDLQAEIESIEVIRRQMSAILNSLPEEAFQRTGVHAIDGPLTLQTYIERITNHIPHHARTIADKRRALGLNIEIAGL